MKIGVFSPGRQFGASTVSILLSEALSMKMATQVILTALDPHDSTHAVFLDLPDTKEITRSLKQVNAMLDAGAISGDEVKNYAIKRGEYFSVLNPAVEDLSEDEMKNIVEFISTSIDHDMLVVDANLELGQEAIDMVIDSMDYFVVVLSQSVSAIQKLETWKEKSVSFKEMEEKGILYVVNNYDQQVLSMRDTVRVFDISKNRTAFIPYHPSVKMLSNSGRLAELTEKFEEKDIRFLKLKESLDDMVNRITADIGLDTV